MNEADKLIENQLKNLPPAVGQAISRVDWKNKVKKISAIHNLTLEQSEALEAEVLLLIYSFEPPDNFLNNLIENVAVEEEEAEKIADTVEIEIVLNIVKELDSIPAELQNPSNSPTLEHTPIIDLSKELELEAPKSQPLIETPMDTAHTTPTQTEKPATPEPLAQTPRYTGGIDPYREGLN